MKYDDLNDSNEICKAVVKDGYNGHFLDISIHLNDEGILYAKTSYGCYCLSAEKFKKNQELLDFLMSGNIRSIVQITYKKVTTEHITVDIKDGSAKMQGKVLIVDYF